MTLVPSLDEADVAMYEPTVEELESAWRMHTF